jgi:uncharacterized protein YwqG
MPSKVADLLIASLRPSIRITFQDDVEIQVGQSRFAGWPDVPADFKWPTCVGAPNTAWWTSFHAAERRRLGPRAVSALPAEPAQMYEVPKPLSLLAQINLTELPGGWDVGLPQSGQLLFFCDIGDELVFGGASEPLDRWRVIWLNAPDPLELMPRPGEDPAEPPPAAALCFEPEWTLCDDVRMELDGEEEESAFLRVREMLIGNWGSTQHRLMGHPQAIQGGLEYDAELTLRQGLYDDGIREAEVDRVRESWRLLLQLDGDEDFEWWWGDVGRMHFMIRQEDLERQRFDRVAAVMQCH